MIEVDGKYHVWTKRLGRGRIKLLTLHGGPGCTHEYFECFEDFLPEAGVEFYYYDQLSSVYSDQPDDKSLWSLPRFVEEVEQVRKGLGLDDFYLLGHSWGSMLAIDYALKYQQHLKGLVLCDMTAGIQAYLKYVNALVDELPADVRSTVRKYESEGKFDAPEYQDALMEHFYKVHICRLDPWPEPVQRCFNHFEDAKAQVVYNTMQGPNETQVTGNLKDWERWDDLPKIKVPTLTIGARYDEMNPAEMEKIAKLVARGRYGYCPNGSHFSMWDDQAVYFRHLITFLHDVDAGRFKA